MLEGDFMKNKDDLLFAAALAGIALATGIFASFATAVEIAGNKTKELVDDKLLDKSLKLPDEEMKNSWIIK